ncbi:MAG: hypothetical protein CMJ75_20160 [Planctomycetaceae bacterium]|nr:hypothetical protein [Planctomycetaceae bacterium]
MSIPVYQIATSRASIGSKGLPVHGQSYASTTAYPLQRRNSLCALALLLLFTGPATRNLLSQELWDYSPYRIRVLLAVEETSRLTARRTEHVARTLPERARVWAGPTLKLFVSKAPAQLHADALYHMDQITDDQIAEHWIKWNKDDETVEELSGDKVILVSIRDTRNMFHIQARELDCRTRFWGPIINRLIAHPLQVAHEAFAALADAFAPLARIERIEGKAAFCRVRAGGLIQGGESSPIAISRGDVLRPMYRRNNREGQPILLQAIPWTFLHVASSSGTLLNCNVHTGIRSPLRGRSTSRTQRYGLGIRPVHTRTQLQLTSTNDTAQTLTGYDIYSKDPVLAAADAPPTNQPKTLPPYFGRSDWRGIVDIPKGKIPLRIIYVKNGNNLLARLPIVPGLEELQIAEMRNDDPRLLAEDYTRQIHARVIGLVTARQLIVARVEQRIRDEKLDEAKTLVEELRQLATRDDIATMIEDYQNRVATEIDRFPATKSRSRQDLNNTQGKIDRLFGNVRALLDQFLDPNLVEDLEQKIATGDLGGSAETSSENTTEPEATQESTAPATKATPSQVEKPKDEQQATSPPAASDGKKSD